MHGSIRSLFSSQALRRFAMLALLVKVSALLATKTPRQGEANGPLSSRNAQAACPCLQQQQREGGLRAVWKSYEEPSSRKLIAAPSPSRISTSPDHHAIIMWMLLQQHIGYIPNEKAQLDEVAQLHKSIWSDKRQKSTLLRSQVGALSNPCQLQQPKHMTPFGFQEWIGQYRRNYVHPTQDNGRAPSQLIGLSQCCHKIHDKVSESNEPRPWCPQMSSEDCV